MIYGKTREELIQMAEDLEEDARILRQMAEE